MIYTFSCYLDFLESKVGQTGTRTGLKGQLSHSIGCQQTYLSKVLKRQAHLSHEQALGAARFFNLSEEETEYFLLLVSKSRAGSKELRSHYEKQLKKFREQIVSVEKKTSISEFLSREDQQIYYSSWYYVAFHIAVSLPTVNNIEDLASGFGLEREIAAEIAAFLLKTGLIESKGHKLIPGPTHIHLKKKSPDLLKHHTNWRLQALNRVSNPSDESFHYTVVASLSERDAKKLKAGLVDWVDQFLKTIEPSKEETVYCHTLDFFKAFQ